MIWLWTMAAWAQSPQEAEAAWWGILGEVVPGRPGADQALLRWLDRYDSGLPRARVVRVLFDAYQYGDHRSQMRAFELARAPLHRLESRRGHRQIVRLESRLPDEFGHRERSDLQLDRVYTQLTASPAAIELRGVGTQPGLYPGFGAHAHLGVQSEILDLEGLWLLGLSLDGAWNTLRQPVGRVELMAGVGGDGLLLFAGGGLSTELGLHQFTQVQLTNDGDGLWPVIALRLQAEEAFGEEALTVSARALLQIGFKFGETPD